MTHYKGVLTFDFNRTLIDPVPAIVSTINQVLKDFDHEMVAEEDIAARVGLPLDHIWRDLAQVHPSHWPEYNRHYHKIYDTQAIPVTKLLPGVRETMIELRESGWHLSIASAKTVPVIESMLQQVEIREMFDLLMGNDVVDLPKPHSEMLFRIMEYFGYSASQLIVIGDTFHDVIFARSAGVKVITVTTGSHKVELLEAAEPEAILHSLQELPGFLATWNY